MTGHEEPITVCIPTYNRWEQLRCVLPSYQEQDLVQAIHILIDGSDDGTASGLTREFGHEPRLRVLQNRQNSGLCRARNQLLDSVRTQYLLMGEDDVWLQPGLVRRLYDVLRQFDADGVCSRVRYIKSWDEIQQPIPEPPPLPGPNVWTEDEVVGLNLDLQIAGPTRVIHMASQALLRTALAQRVRYDPWLKRYRDETDFYLRASREGCRFYFVPDVCMLHRTDAVQGRRRGGVHGKGGLQVEFTKIADHARMLRRHLRYLCDTYGKPYRPAYYPVRYAWHHLVHKYWGLAPVSGRPGATPWAKRRHFAVEVARRLTPPSLYRVAQRLRRLW